MYENVSQLSKLLQHKSLPIVKLEEFNFFRCVNIQDWVYRRTISELHLGNLRENGFSQEGRYSKLFPNEKVSYWADSKSTALAEIRHHNGNKNYLTFWAYDDMTSTFPTMDEEFRLTIIDARLNNFHEILLKVNSGEKLTDKEIDLVEQINQLKPDCLAYKSVVNPDGINFMFFERGFKKLSLREVKLYLGEKKEKNSNRVVCAITSDYSPRIDSYGKYFEPITKIRMDKKYLETEEYKSRRRFYNKSLKRLLY